MKRFPPKCRCAELSTQDSVLTCPECIAAALRWGPLGGLAQLSLFAEVDTTGSVSAVDEDEDGLTHISRIVPVVLDGLPF